MKIIKTWRDPYDEGFSTCRPKEITLNEGLTVLVGCNGAGKTTLLRNIKEIVEKEKLPYLYFDNKSDGGSHSIESLMYRGNVEDAVFMWTASEGEQIQQNVGRIASELREFLKTGETRESKSRLKWNNAFGKHSKKSIFKPSKERWLLFDAIDSGYSIDNVIELKEIFKLILEDSIIFNVKTYIIISANEYELANGENCFDVNTGKYIKFNDYEDFKAFIIKSRERKEKRYQMLHNKNQKKMLKEREKRNKEKQTNNIKEDNVWKKRRQL